ncbi:MAG: hypothetical protein RL662_408 [Bacteroidota bacterium]
MKKYTIFTAIAVLAGALFMTSCGDDFLTNNTTEKQEAGAPATEGAVLASLASTYQILLLDSYAKGNFNSLILTSDLRSDDLYKGGGDAGDQNQLYRLSQFTSTGTETLDGLWSVYYSGLSRANNVLISCENPVNINANKLEQYKAEAHFLRAYFMHILWKYWGNVPYFEKPLVNPPYMTKQLTADEVYQKIMADLDFACTDGKLKMKMTGSDVGRASRAAALMLKARVVLYEKDAARYAEITNDMASIIASKEFQLMDDFGAIWVDKGEFCPESIFESNQIPEGKTWAESWMGYGTNLPAFISPSSLNDPNKIYKGGWGFAPVRKEAYEMYEIGDHRRDSTIVSWAKGMYSARFQDTGLFNRKYAAREGYNPPPGDQDLNYANNVRIFRYSETLLNYAELVKIHGQAEQQGVVAQDCFNQIRKRAFKKDSPLTATADNIKLERRREFLGEGMRFWDLVRWGDAAKALTENNTNFNSVRTFEEWKKHLPIPQAEIEKTKNTEFELKQNGQWN